MYHASMSPALLLTIYCTAIFLASLAGGWFTMLVKLTHRRLELALSFVSGVMLGIAMLHLLPESIAQFNDAAAHQHAAGAGHAHIGVTSMWWLLGGFLGIFLLQRFFPFHHHEPAVQSSEPTAIETAVAAHDHACGHNHQDHHHHHTHGHSHDHSRSEPSRWLSWPAALLGFTIHTIVGGMALAAAVGAESDAHAAKLAGLGVFLVIVLHKPFDSMTIGTLMAAGKSPNLSRHIVNAFFGLMTALGVVFFNLGLSQMDLDRGPLLGAVLALSAGMFLCIALSDILPELQFHSHDRIKLSLALLAGLALAGTISYFEARGHAHGNEIIEQQPHDHDHDHDGHDHDHDHAWLNSKFRIETT